MQVHHTDRHDCSKLAVTSHGFWSGKKCSASVLSYTESLYISSHYSNISTQNIKYRRQSNLWSLIFTISQHFVQ